MLARCTTALVLLSGASVSRADVIYDTLWITDQHAYDVGLGNAFGGRGAFGELEDVRLADDFVIDPAAYPNGLALTSVAQDSFAAIGAPPSEGFVVRVYPDVGGRPADQPSVEASVPLKDALLTEFDDPLFGNIGVRFELDLTSYDIQLPPGVHWINIPPVDTTPQGDWWWQLWDQDTHLGGDAHTWLEDWGFWASHGPGAAAMRIEGVAIPAPGAALACTLFCPLACRRRSLSASYTAAAPAPGRAPASSAPAWRSCRDPGASAAPRPSA